MYRWKKWKRLRSNGKASILTVGIFQESADSTLIQENNLQKSKEPADDNTGSLRQFNH